jgi:hypothetical protein
LIQTSSGLIVETSYSISSLPPPEDFRLPVQNTDDIHSTNLTITSPERYLPIEFNPPCQPADPIPVVDSFCQKWTHFKTPIIIAQIVRFRLLLRVVNSALDRDLPDCDEAIQLIEQCAVNFPKSANRWSVRAEKVDWLRRRRNESRLVDSWLIQKKATLRPNASWSGSRRCIRLFESGNCAWACAWDSE